MNRLTINRQEMSKKDRWRLRNRLLWRVKGTTFPHYSVEEGIITEDELKLIRTINNCVHTLIENSVENSRKLGFKALYRDSDGDILKDDPRNKDI